MVDLKDLYELKAKFEKEKLMAEAKVSVVNEMIANELEKEKQEEVVAEETLMV